MHVHRATLSKAGLHREQLSSVFRDSTNSELIDPFEKQRVYAFFGSIINSWHT